MPLARHQRDGKPGCELRERLQQGLVMLRCLVRNSRGVRRDRCSLAAMLRWSAGPRVDRYRPLRLFSFLPDRCAQRCYRDLDLLIIGFAGRQLLQVEPRDGKGIEPGQFAAAEDAQHFI